LHESLQIGNRAHGGAFALPFSENMSQLVASFDHAEPQQGQSIFRDRMSDDNQTRDAKTRVAGHNNVVVNWRIDWWGK
jgi:hypothetical protein